MKRNKDEDKDDGIVSGATSGNVANANNNAKISNNAASNTSGSSNDANISSGGTAGTVRTTGRVKKPKQVYDPSDNYISRGSRNSLPTPISISTPSPALAAAAVSANATTSTTLAIRAASPAQPANPNEISPSLASIVNSSSNNNSNSSINNDDPMDGMSVHSAEHQRNYDTCKKCGKSEPKRGSGYKSNFLTCKTCSLKWHFNCLPVTFEVLTNARKRYKCDKCRRCRICVSSRNNEQLMMCSLCANAFHLDCHRPRVMRSKLNDSKWKCYDCDPKYNSFDAGSAADGVAIVESQSQPSMQTSSSSSSSPPRKLKAGRKKRATSDPAAGNAKIMAFGKQMLGNEDEGDNGNGAGASGGGGAIDRAATKSVIPQLVQATESIKSNDDEETVSPKSNPQSPHASNASIVDLNLDSSMSSPTEAKENQDSSAQNVAAAMSDELQLEQQKSVRSWSVEQVVNFVKRFYPRESDVFEAQEIDGAALMVLTRQDIIDRFGLKLGPALRIFELVLLLQTSTDDVSLAWCN